MEYGAGVAPGHEVTVARTEGTGDQVLWWLDGGDRDAVPLASAAVESLTV